MKDKMNKILNQSNIIILSIITLLIVYSCSKDDGGGGDDNVVVVKTPTVNVNKTSIQFDDTMITKSSNSSKNLTLIVKLNADGVVTDYKYQSIKY